MAAERLSVIENQSSGDFNRGWKKSLVRHYPYFEVQDWPTFDSLGTVEQGKRPLARSPSCYTHLSFVPRPGHSEWH
jgi:hypothetical protein